MPDTTGLGIDQSNTIYLQHQKARDAAYLILKKKYNNLRKMCEQNCKCFTGPHSVLQIFIEKIVEAIESFVEKLRVLTRDELQLWTEENKNDESEEGDEKNLNELNYTINNIDLNLIFKMLDQQSKDGLLAGFKQGLLEAAETEEKPDKKDT